MWNSVRKTSTEAGYMPFWPRLRRGGKKTVTSTEVRLGVRVLLGYLRDSWDPELGTDDGEGYAAPFPAPYMI